MATDAPPTSSSQEDKIKQQEEWTKFLQEPGTVDKFNEACKNIGQAAVAIEYDFKTVKVAFTKFVEKYGTDFPEVGSFYASKWDKFIACWNGETGILWSSRKLAAEIAATLTDYSLNLELVADIKTEDDLKGAQDELKHYVEKHPIEIATEVEDRAMDLKSDIHDFSVGFAEYVEIHLGDATIKQYQVEITEYIKTASTNLDCCFAFGMLSTVPTNFLPDVILQRDTTQQKVYATLANRRRMFDKLMAILAMQATLDIQKPDIDGISRKFRIFAIIWAFTTEQSIEIMVALDEGLTVLMRKEFQVKLKLLTAQVGPLKEGMRRYATQIVPPNTSSNVE
ncbi:hypothetical protein AGABI1DRAFT_115754 [Agaricus bisporus var. burnettii JB137-S8]|uniref:Uncharacterized protein n=1 Tax=Agaricus bisporus var. burnettii (strain JB137-S8 / ATCC MYA-4627 / FGSC 10392) TaxID=597362 RepID=K5VPK4_AGABU|nr:uncharacterized protein AGABI1DRAFT_115754 [Agaricus bisporus var. burnettii JB137-S8]EKM76404.1 hypothetical protein AGABI1DRAFT_115754 [Agaricus bisporus var. burnettii JB137-S8]